MAPFKPRPQHELSALADEELLAYVVAARAAGRLDEAAVGLQLLVYGHYDNVYYRVALKVPEWAAEEVAGKAFDSALKAAFEGSSLGQFRKLLNTITSRRIADFHKARKPDSAPLPEEHEGDDDVYGPWLAADGGQGAVEVKLAIEEAYQELGDEHRRVVELSCFQDLPAAQVAAPIAGMTEANVYKIVQRFRDRVRELLAGDG